MTWEWIILYDCNKIQFLTPNFVQFLHATIFPLGAFEVMLKHPHSMLYLGFFDVEVDWGLKNVIISLTSVSLPEVWVLALAAKVQGSYVLELSARVIASAGDTTPKMATSSVSMLGEEESLGGDWNGGKKGWVQLVVIILIEAASGKEGCELST